MADYDTPVSDWEINSCADFGAGLVVAGYTSHFSFESPSLGVTVHGIYIGGGVGVSASLNLPGVTQMFNHALGSTDDVPSVGQSMVGVVLKPFTARRLAAVTCTVFNAGVAAGVAPADIQWLRFGSFFQAQKARATVKAAVEVGANWTAGRFYAIHPQLGSYGNYLDQQHVKQVMQQGGIDRSRGGMGGL